MTIARWTPPVAPTRQEQFMLKRLGRVRKLLGFLRLHRHELFDDAFQDELAAMYRTTGAGKEARPPAMMAMATLVQGYLGMSDAEMIELTVLDLRVQMVLGCLGAEAPPFSQGALQEFRERLIAADLDRRVLERTVELAKATQAFDYREAAEDLARGDRFESAGGRGTGRRHVQLAGPCRAATWWRVRPACWGGPRSRCVARRAFRCSSTSSIKRALDIDWNDAVEKTAAITTFTRQLDALQSWIAQQLPEDIAQAAAQGAGRGPGADPHAGSGARSHRAVGRAFVRAWRRIAASRSRTRRCVTAARARASGSTDSSVTSPRTSIAV